MKNLFDFIMILATGGLWLIWMVVRYMNKKERNIK